MKRIIVLLIIFFILVLILSIYFLNTSSNSNIKENNRIENSKENIGFKTEIIAQNLDVPWELIFVPDGRIFFTERKGLIRIIENGKLKDEPLAEINVLNIGEGGLLGLAPDPEFSDNHYVYAYYTYRGPLGQILNRVIRLTERNGKAGDQFVVIDNIPGGGNHDGGRIKFGPDGKLYITTGDAGSSDFAQDRSSLAGKILRINPDGSIPNDNPIEKSPVFSYGHRNPQGLAFHPVTNRLFATEHGPLAHDEINLIEKGSNYGWPSVRGISNNSSYIDPIAESGNDTWAPSGATFYNGNIFPQWENDLFFAGLRGEGVWRVEINDSGRVENMEKIIDARFGRIRNIVQGPDGLLYFMTNNRDGRGNPDSTDDKITRIVTEK